MSGRIFDLPLDKVALPSWGWHEDDALFMEKLGTSLERHGQLMPVAVRMAGMQYEVVDGRKRVLVMRLLGHKTVTVTNVGTLEEPACVRIALDLELLSNIHYVSLARQLAALAKADDAPETLPGRLAATTPWDAERIGYFLQLAEWDWSQYSGADADQAGFAWDTLPEEPLPGLAGPQAAAGLPGAAAVPAVPQPASQPAASQEPAAQAGMAPKGPPAGLAGPQAGENRPAAGQEPAGQAGQAAAASRPQAVQAPVATKAAARPASLQPSLFGEE